MLHIDRNTERYLFELDNMFTATSPLMSQGIRKEINKTFDDIQLDWDKQFARVEKGITSFENKLLKALDEPLPHYYIGKPRPKLRKFPFRVTGEMHDSFYGSVTKTDGDNSMLISYNSGFHSNHAERTSGGWNSGKREGTGGAPDVHWLHWYDNVFGDTIKIGGRHSTKVPNIRDVLLGYYS